MSDKVSRRSFIKMLGIGGAGIAGVVSGILPLPVDMSKAGRENEVEEIEAAVKEQGGELVTGGFSTRSWVHPCSDRTEPGEDCKHCHYYFCPVEAATVYRWRHNEFCEVLHGENARLQIADPVHPGQYVTISMTSALDQSDEEDNPS